MKRIFYIVLISLVAISSCTKDNELIFDQSPEERLDAVLSQYKDQLTKGDGLWITYYGGSAILMKFNKDNTVEFNSTYHNGSEDRTISYKVGASQVPELVFESHSVFHAIYEEDRSEREYEFLFEKISDEQIDFVSKTDLGEVKTKVSFYKGAPQDIDLVKEMTAKFINLSYFKKITVEGSTYDARLITFPGKAILKEFGSEGTKLSDLEFQITKKGLQFYPPIYIDGDTITSFSYNEDTNLFIADQGEKKVTINILDTPLNSEEGVFNKFKDTNFKQVVNYSYNMDSTSIYLFQDIPYFNEFLLYVNQGYVICYAPGTEGGSMSGFAHFYFNKFSEDRDDILVDWEGYVYGNWWRDVYQNSGGQMFLNFLLDPQGLYIEQIKSDSYCLVSISNPSQFILVE